MMDAPNSRVTKTKQKKIENEVVNVFIGTMCNKIYQL